MSRHLIGASDNDPNGRHTVLVDTEGACLLDHTTAALVEGTGDGTVVGLELEGRVNQKRYRHTQLYLMDAEGAAALIAELVGVYHRAGGPVAARFVAALDTAVEALP